MTVHADVYEHLSRGGFRCKECGVSAPCSWQIKHTTKCKFKHFEGRSMAADKVNFAESREVTVLEELQALRDEADQNHEPSRWVAFLDKLIAQAEKERARSQGLEAFARIMASRFPGTWIAVKANAALGLPNEEGETADA